jgi:transposase
LEATGEALPERLFEEVVTDKGYHSNQCLRDLQELGLRTYVSEPERGRRKWREHPEARQAVYANRRRVKGERGKRLQRSRGERLERSNAHLYETGGMRRTHLRGHDKIAKRLIVHAAGFNLGLLLRHVMGIGKPRRLQDFPGLLLTLLVWICGLWQSLSGLARTCGNAFRGRRKLFRLATPLADENPKSGRFSTGC